MTEYEQAEERVINELKEINKPFTVILNCMYPGRRKVQNSLRPKCLKNMVSLLCQLTVLKCQKGISEWCFREFWNSSL